VKFDPEQLQAVNTEAARTLVVSVPGSGKTTVLVGRILRMIERGTRPEDITAITFTRYAAEEIRKRIGPAGRGVWIGTLHALALRIVRASAEVGGYSEDWLSIISDDEAEADMHLAMRDVGLIAMRAGKVCWSEVTAGAWEKFVGDVSSGALREEDDEDSGHLLMWKAWNLYLSRLRSQNTLTFGSMLIEAMRVLADRSTLLFWRRTVRHVLVDEAQDTSNIQWSIVWRLVEKTDPDSLFVVGDDDQSLYGWRGAVPDQMVKMADGGFEVVKLCRCYRFGAGIANPASALIANNSVRVAKDLVPCGATPGVLEVVWDADVADVVYWVSQAVGGPHGAAGVAVLARTHAVLGDVEEGLVKAGIPCHRAGKLSSLRKTTEFRALMCYLRLAVNPFDRRSFSGICATEGISPEAMISLRSQSLATGRSLVDVFGLDLSPLSRDGGFMWLGKYAAERDQSRNYKDAAQYLVGTAFLNGLATPRDVLDWVAMADVQDDLRRENPNSVTLATIHAAKGLEWPVVFVVGMNDGILPSLRNGSDLEEERRLAYVAMTRARERVVLVHIDAGRTPSVSRFCGEVGLVSPWDDEANNRSSVSGPASGTE